MDFAYFVTNWLPLFTTIGLAIIGYAITGLNRRIDRVEDDVKDTRKEIGDIKQEIGELKGLITGYFSRPSDR